MSVARTWKSLLDRRDVLIIDTETTGLDSSAELVEISIIDTTGAVVYDELVMPQGHIPPDASRIHGLTKNKLEQQGALPWSRHYEAVKTAVLESKVIRVYNLEYDEMIITQTCRRYSLPPILSVADRNGVKLGCSMLDYANHRKVPGYYGDYRWHKLEVACRYEGIPASHQDHRALSDCQMVLSLMRAVASGN